MKTLLASIVVSLLFGVSNTLARGVGEGFDSAYCVRLGDITVNILKDRQENQSMVFHTFEKMIDEQLKGKDKKIEDAKTITALTYHLFSIGEVPKDPSTFQKIAKEIRDGVVKACIANQKDQAEPPLSYDKFERINGN